MPAITSCLRGLVLCVLVALSPPLLAADWPQWRGPNRDACSAESGLLQQWPEGGPPLAWKATGLGAGYSGVSVAGGRVFTMGGYRDSTCVIASSEEGGKQIWSAKIGGPGVRGGHPGPRCTPTVSGDQVIALTQDGDLACLAVADGKEAWRKSLRSDFGGRPLNPQFGYCESPLVDGDKVVCTPGGANGAVLALDKAIGRPVWQSKELTDSAGYSSAIVAEIDGVRQYIVTTESSVAGVAASDGALLWRSPRKGQLSTVPTPVYRNGLVYVTASLENGEALKVSAAGGKWSCQRVYANRNILSDFGGVVPVNGYLYGYSARKGLVCQELSSGREMWADDSFGPCSVACADGCLYLRNPSDKRTKGPAYAGLAKATPEGYKELGRFTPPDRSNKLAYPHPVVANGRLFLRDQDILLCYDVKAK